MISASGALLGLLGGAGLWLALVRLPPLRQPTLEQRLAPYLRETPRPSRLLLRPRTHTPLPSLERILRPYVGDAVRLLERVLGGGASVRRRLEQAGRATTLEEFRAEQVLWGAAAMLGAVVVSVAILARGQVRAPVVLLVFCAAAGVAGVLARDRWLGHEIEMRERAMIAEFPTIAELLALAVGAGEGAVGALERVARICTGELSREMGRALADARAGASLVTALTGIAERTTLPALVRFVDGVAVAVERGTPLADVLRAQAGDVRDMGRRALMETGGRKEIAMMVPVVFLVLPVTVVFALYPGLANLSLTF